MTRYAPEVTQQDVTFRLPDPDDALSEVNLLQELQRPRVGPAFSKKGDMWELTFVRPEVDRMEYRFQLEHDDGGIEDICDPANDLVAPGPFGDKSVVEFPGYEPPEWTQQVVAARGSTVAIDVPARSLRKIAHALLWSSSGLERDDPAPVLIAHDGPEYAEFSQLLDLLAHAVETELLPACRALLLPPIERDEHYSASAAYGRSFAHEILPALLDLAPVPPGRDARVGMGASLGALSMLHLHRTYPATFGALFLQSGSFFRQRFDKQEAGFPRFGRIARFMGRVLNAEHWAHPVEVTMTCGSVEENLANNEATRDALVSQGYGVTFVEHRDAHNWISWRDTFDPHLIDLLGKTWT